MIITNDVEVKIINHNINHYREMGYSVKYGDIIKVKPLELSKGSHIKIQTRCNKCGIINSIKYQDYVKITKDNKFKYYCYKCVKIEKNEITNLIKYGVKNPSSLDFFKKKRTETVFNKWGVKNIFQSDLIKDKIKETNMQKYGFIYPTKSDIIKIKSMLNRIKNGKQIKPEYYTEFNIYRKNVLSVTRKYKMELFENWDGCDYYDGEYIKDYLTLDSNNVNYPTIDHKISVFDGFLNNMDINDIGSLSNLCLTKRKINSSKTNKSEDVFKKEFEKNDIKLQ